MITMTFQAESRADLVAQLSEFLEGDAGLMARREPPPSEHDEGGEEIAVTNDDYRRAIKAIPAGKAAAYSVVSEVVRGDAHGSQKAAGLAANDPTLGTAYRVVKVDRGIAAGFRWTDGRMGGADEARRLLEEEGVEFDVHGRVKPEFRLTADELRELYEQS